MSGYPITSTVSLEGVSLDPGKLSLTDGTFSTSIRPDDATTSYDLLLPPQAGTVGQTLTMSSATETDWVTPPLIKQIWIIEDIKSSGTNGGVISSSPQTRDLNTITSSPAASTDVQLAVAPAGANQLLIEPGEYFVYCKSPLGAPDVFSTNSRYVVVLWNDSTSSAVLTSTSANTDRNMQTSSYIMGTINVAVQNIFSIRIYSTNIIADTVRCGRATGIAGADELYSAVYIEKLA